MAMEGKSISWESEVSAAPYCKVPFDMSTPAGRTLAKAKLRAWFEPWLTEVASPSLVLYVLTKSRHRMTPSALSALEVGPCCKQKYSWVHAE